MGCQVAVVYAVVNGYLNGIPAKEVHSFEERLFEHMENKYQNLLVRFETGYFDPEDVEALKAALSELTR